MSSYDLLLFVFRDHNVGISETDDFPKYSPTINISATKKLQLRTSIVVTQILLRIEILYVSKSFFSSR